MINPSRLCVLIVDDDESSRLVAVELFRDDGYLVVDVGSEEAALAELHRAFVTFDPIVLNIRIPGLGWHGRRPRRCDICRATETCRFSP